MHVMCIVAPIGLNDYELSMRILRVHSTFLFLQLSVEKERKFWHVFNRTEMTEYVLKSINFDISYSMN